MFSFLLFYSTLLLYIKNVNVVLMGVNQCLHVFLIVSLLHNRSEVELEMNNLEECSWSPPGSLLNRFSTS